METIKKFTVGSACRQLGQCDPNAEIGMSIGTIPLLIPIESISIRQNENNEEVIAFNIIEENLKQIFNKAIEVLEGG